MPKKIKPALPLILVLLGVCAFGQTNFPATSATDKKVKIHREKSWKKPGAYARVTERQGEYVQKDKPSRNPGKDARVFKRHNQTSQAPKSRKNRSPFARLFKKKKQSAP